MGKYTQTSIEINGKRYDARTGKLVSPEQSAAPTVSQPKAAMSDIRPRAVATHHTVHKATERSKTLMRHAVKKPVAKPVHRAQSGIRHTSSTPQHQPTQPLYNQYDKNREERAQSVQRSNLVSKFSDIMSRPSGSMSSAPVSKPVEKKVQPLAVQAAPALHQPAVQFSAPSKAESVLARGLLAAQSHTEAAPATYSDTKRTKRRKLLSIGATSLSVLLLSAFIFYQNAPNLALRYASARAGIEAQLPDYQPSGFALDNRIHYTTGQITMNFASNSDERQFTITQRSSGWNSEELMGNYVASASDRVQTYEDKGRTIYLYGDANATWVNGGVWYDINGNSQLNSDQLVRIATSM